MNVHFVTFEQTPLDVWSNFVDGCEECWIFHKPEFILANQADSRSFSIYHENTLVGVGVFYVNKVMFGKVLGDRIGPAGLALKKNISQKVYSAISQYLQYLAKENGCLAIQMQGGRLAEPNVKQDYLNTHLGRMGFSLGLRLGFGTDYEPSYTAIIELSKSLEDISDDFSTLIRRKLSKFRKLEYSYACFENDIQSNRWDEFVVNHHATFQMTGAQPFSDYMLKFLHSLLIGGMALLINMYVAKECCGSLYLLIYKKRAFYFASGVKPEYYFHGGAAFLHWLAIRELKERNYLFYEVGQFFPSKTLEGTKIHSIGQFKRMFCSEYRMIISGEFVVDELQYFLRIILPSYFRKAGRILKIKWARV